MLPDQPFDAVAFDCFGTLVAANRPDDPAAAVAAALDARGVSVPEDWADAYAEQHVESRQGGEVSLPAHVRAALSSRARSTDRETVEAAVFAAFDANVAARDGAIQAVEAAAERGPVGVLSNCSVPGLVDRSLDAAGLSPTQFDAVVTSVDCGWRKPDARAFEAVADALGVAPDGLLYLGDDSEVDGGATDVGATSLLVQERPLSEIAWRLEDRRWA